MGGAAGDGGGGGGVLPEAEEVGEGAEEGGEGEKVEPGEGFVGFLEGGAFLSKD